MPTPVYKTPNWDTHSESDLLDLDFPLFNVGVEDHFSFLRTLSGPLDTMKMPAQAVVDSVFDGELHGDFTGTDADDVFVLGSAHNLLTGIPVTLSIDSGLSGLTNGGSYWVIRVDSTRIKLANSLANARAGTAASLGSDGVADLRYPKAYLVGHSKTDDADGGQVRYTQLFATVPPSWSDLEPATYEYPSVSQTALGTSRAVTAIAESGSNLVLTVAADPALASGDACYVSLKFTRNGLVYQFSGFTKATAVSTGTTATIGKILLGSGAFSSVSGSIVKASAARTVPKTMDVSYRVVHDYAYTTVASLNADLPLSPRFAPIVTSTGIESGGVINAFTTPTAAEYAALAAAGSEIVAQGSTHDRYLGNIFVRRTPMVRAQ